jgi:hypothetical protein
MLYQDINADELTSEIRIEPITDLSAFLSPKAFFEEHIPTIRVYSVEYNRISRTIKVVTEKLLKEIKIQLLTEEPTQTIECIQDLSEGQFEINLNKGIPREIILADGKAITRRRIFYDKDYFIRRAARANVSIKEVIDRLDSDRSIDARDLFILLGGIVRRPGHIVTDTEGKQKPHEETERPPNPPRPPPNFDVGGITKLLRNLAEFYDMISINKQRELSDDLLKEEDAEQEKKINKKLFYEVETDKVNKTIKKIIVQLDEILKFRFQRDSNDYNARIYSQIMLILCYLKLFRMLSVDREIVELLKARLTASVKGIRGDVIDAELKLKFLKYLVCLSYNIQEPLHFDFTSEIFTFHELIKRELYYDVKEFTREMASSKSTIEAFDSSLFKDCYVYIPSYCDISESFDKYLLELCARTYGENDSEFQEVLLRILNKLNYRFSVSESIKNEIRKLDFSGNPELGKKIIESVEW